MNLDFKTKFDIVICRGVIQHTPNPKETIKKIHSFVDPKGFVFFDVYKMPKLGYLHPKYLIWRPFFKFFFTYEGVKKFLIKNISWLLKVKNFIRRIFLNSYFISDIFIPIWSYEGKLELSKKMQEKWSVLDTLDGLFAKYDKPISNKNILKLLKNNKFKVINNDKKNNIFQTKT